jgi:ketosteroid isomerase-like protein
MAPANRSSADAARRWAQAWRTCWERLDTEPIVALYADDAVLSTEPFREPYLGQDGVRTYIARVFAEEEDPHVNVAEQWDTWNVLRERRRPPSDWGPFR